MVGDSLKFTNATSEGTTNSARGFVSVVGGRILSEESTTSTSEHIIIEDATTEQFGTQSLLLDGTSVATAAVEPYAVLCH